MGAGINLICQDCLAQLPLFKDNTFDFVLADMPYSVLNKGNKDAQWDKEIDLDTLWPELLRVCKPNAAIVIFGQGLFSAKLMLSQPKLYRYSLVWDKVRTTGFLNANRMPLRQHEDILVFYRHLPVYNPQMRVVASHLRTHSRGHVSSMTNRCYGDFNPETKKEITNEKFPTSILRFQKKHKEWFHPTEKDVSLLEYLIRTYTDEGGMVLDFCMGSGSTMVACANTARRGVGIEIDPKFYNIACKRVAEAKYQQSNLDLYASF